MSSRSILALSASQEGREKKVITAMKDNFAAVRAGLPPQLLLLLVCESGVTKSNGFASALWPLVLQ